MAETTKFEILKSIGQSQCSFCYFDILEGEGIMLNNCLHSFCRNCLVIAIEQSQAPQIQCPVHSETECGGFLLDPEIRSLVSPESYEKYLARSLTLARKEDGQFCLCQKKDCHGMCYLEKGVTNFCCTLCHESNCIKCGNLHSEASTCPRAPRARGVKRKLENEKENEKREAEKKLETETKAAAELKSDWEIRWEQMRKLVQSTNLPNSTDDGDETRKNSLVDILESELIISTEAFECSICMIDVPTGDGIILQECFHVFCRGCLKSTIEFSEQPEVQCPFQGTHTSCGAFIQEREIKALVSKEVHEKYLSRSICKAELCSSNAFHCKSVNCTAWCEVEPGSLEFLCPICNKTNCIKCKTIHEAVSCKEYQRRIKHECEDQASADELNRLIKQGKAMRCPTCKVVIVKNGGCDGIECRICRTMLCWATKGPRWGPKGRGDTSGGCRCGVKRKKCHPKCGGCH